MGSLPRRQAFGRRLARSSFVASLTTAHLGLGRCASPVAAAGRVLTAVVRQGPSLVDGVAIAEALVLIGCCSSAGEIVAEGHILLA